MKSNWKLIKFRKKVLDTESELSDLVKKQVRLEEHGELAKKLVLKDGKCPVCDSSVDHSKAIIPKKAYRRRNSGNRKKNYRIRK